MTDIAQYMKEHWVAGIILIVIIVLILLVIIVDAIIKGDKGNKSLKEEYLPLRYKFPNNTSMWPKWYYRSPFFNGLEASWGPNMFSKTRFWTPTFYTGSGLQYYLRPGINDWNYSKLRFSRPSRDYYYLFGRYDEDHGSRNYNY